MSSNTRAKPRPRAATFHCTSCGHTLAKWMGRCPECRTWGSIPEQPVRTGNSGGRVVGTPSTPALPISTLDSLAADGAAGGDAAAHRPTGVNEFDRVLGGGLVDGAVVLLAGEPGVGKSTLLLDVARRWVQTQQRALYVTGEESVGQVRLRARRIDALHDELYLAAESDVATVLGHLDALQPDLLIVDSVQTMSLPEIDGTAGGSSQVRGVAAALIAAAKQRGLPVILIGHVTKEGTVAGPRLLEHLVDVVLQFEGDRHSTLRIVRGIKNRFGACDEVGCFELRDDGIAEMPDPSGLFTSDRTVEVPGTAVTVVVEGKRPLLGEVQALVASSNQAIPRRAVSGLDTSRVAMVLAVVERRVKVSLGGKDVFTATLGGMRVVEPAADLAVALAVLSATHEVPTSPRTVAIGEVGLTGEIRRVTGVTRRLAEAARLGFTHALVPPDCADGASPAMRVTPVPHLGAAWEAMV